MCCISLLSQTPRFRGTGDRNLKSHQVISAYENMVTLLYIIPAENNYRAAGEDNEQKQRWRHENDIRVAQGD